MQRRDTPDPSADLVLRGGTVHTLDEDDTTGTAIAIRHGRVLRVGSDAEVTASIGRRTRVIELDGRAVIPGINDSHLHATWLGAMWPETVFGAAAGAAVSGSAGDAGGDSAPAAPESADSDPHDTSRSAPLVTTRAERRAAILRAGELIASLGITSYTEPGIGPGEDAGATGCFAQDVFDAYVELEAERLLTARVNVLALFGVLDGPSTLHEVTAGLRSLERETTRPAWLRVAGVKLFGDGIPPMHQAWTRHRYPDGTSGGLLVAGLDADERADNLRRMILEANRLGYQVGIHATGDRTIDTAVSAVEDAMRDSRMELRHYIIHGDLVTPGALSRMAALGMGLNVQPGIAVATASWLAAVLGDEVAVSAWPIAAATRAGVSVSLSSDAPILAPDWRQGIADAAAWLGAPASGHEAEVDRMRAMLRGYTVAPARQDGADPWKGTLEPRKVADFCVLETDPLHVPAAELPAVGVDLTVVDGELVYERLPTYSR
ncbi:amidohydrolase [Leifsonia sp. NPDC102414]|uniref:amidohydrolase n=1 Tax=Leifsonia sp. NPDC102414 TaxID=3364124 RepID=UPI0038005AC2